MNSRQAVGRRWIDQWTTRTTRKKHAKVKVGNSTEWAPRRSVGRGSPYAAYFARYVTTLSGRSTPTKRTERGGRRAPSTRSVGFGVLLAPPLQPGLDEPFDVTVEHRVDAGRLVTGALVLHHLVGLQHVAADL